MRSCIDKYMTVSVLFTCRTNLQCFVSLAEHLFEIMGKMFFRFTMKRSCSMVNWTFSVTQTWWTLPWMCTEVFFLIKTFPIVSMIVRPANSYLEKYVNYISYMQKLKWCWAPSFFVFVSALKEKRTEVVAQLKQLQSETEPIVKMFEDPETTRQMQSTR